MKIIIIKKADGGCSIVNPAPEMFDPNSRTIRLLEINGTVFPEIKRIVDIEAAKFQGIKSRYDEQIRKLAAEAANTELDPKQKDEILARAEVLVTNKENECSSWAGRQMAYEADRTIHPDFNLEQFQKEVMDYIISRNVTEGTQYRVADPSCLPEDRYFRNAWTDDNETETVDVDMTKAREIHKGHMRMAREPYLRGLDIEYQRADEAGDSAAKKSVAMLKQQLRDITKDAGINSARTPAELKAVWPEILGRQP